jgi:hypothetical protein
MACVQCRAGEQRGRFCVGCGRAVPPSHRRAPRPGTSPVEGQAPRPRSPLADELTQPVLRLERPSRPAVPTR